MTSTYDSSGVVMDRYDDILSRYITLAEAQWGEGVDTEEDSLLGHILRNVAYLQAEINEIVQDVYDEKIVDNSTGAHLDALVSLIGLERAEAAFSTVTLSLTATAATTVPAGSRYATAAEVIFATDTELVISGGSFPRDEAVEATCTVVGAFDAAAGEVTVIKTAVYGISACTNAAAAIPGRTRETDADVKEDHTVAVATSGDDDAASIYEALIDVTGVSSAYIFDNDSHEYSGVVPPHTIRCSLIGGSNEDVATAISLNKTAGVGTYGASSYEVYNETTGQAKTINFDRAVNTDTHIEINITAYSDFPDDGDALIRAGIIAHYENIRINDNVIFNALYQPIYAVGGLLVTSLFLGIVDPPLGIIDLVSSPLIRYTIDTDNIDINIS